MKPVCQVSHSQILAGKCPWCDEPLGDRGEGSDGGTPVWNIPAMAAALDDPSEEIRIVTVSNLMSKGQPADQAVPLLSKALTDARARSGNMAAHALCHHGGELSDAEAARFEAQIPGSPHELTIRILLLGFYFLGQRASDAARQARQRHIYWLIQNAPESETAGSPHASLLARSDLAAYTRAKELWLAQIDSHPRETKILGNAASFFTLNDGAMSEKLLREAQSVEPDNPEWHERLGHLYSLRGGQDATQVRTSAASAFREFEAAEQLQRRPRPQSPDESGSEDAEKDTVGKLLMWIHKLPELAKAAFAAGEFEHARNYATELLQKSASPELPEFFREHNGNAIHYANLILGRIAFQSGDIEQAKRHLLASAESSGSPNLNSFGPNMSLARDLLEHGEREVVLAYFKRCALFWKSGDDQLKEWTREIQNGVIPDFGANLRY
jgi:tetratricopeptide (TPR) repeat protein